MIIGVIGRVNGTVGTSHDNLEEIILAFAQETLNRGHDVIVDTASFENYFTSCKVVVSGATLSHDRISRLLEVVDFTVVFGGDGTMLHVAKKALQAHNPIDVPPLLGVNLGRLGFITDVPKDFPATKLLDMIVKKQYKVENRSFLTDGLNSALNEFVIQRATGKVIEFKVFIDSEFAYHARGDGLMISTPTGSTAYALSAGGPILHPSTRVVELIPLFPQTLSCRPLIVDDRSNITVEILDGEANVFADGEEVTKLAAGHHIDVEKYQRSIQFVHPNHPELAYSYFHTLREKLNWQQLPGTPRS